MANPFGELYVVATPIGNLEDITLRAQRVLQEVSIIAAEDTRHTKKLLQHLNISTPMFALHAHNEVQQSEQLLSRLKAGEHVALVTDAGTPAISDPGGRLVLAAQQAKIKVVPVPGASALITALSVAGLTADSFYFAGFLSSKSGARQHQLEKLKHYEVTLVFYEAPHRIVETFADMKKIFGENRYAVICRELTKLYETIQGGELHELYEWLLANPNQQLGEFVIVVQGDTAPAEMTSEHRQILKILLEALPHKQAAQLASQITGISKNKLYDLALQLKML